MNAANDKGKCPSYCYLVSVGMKDCLKKVSSGWKDMWSLHFHTAVSHWRKSEQELRTGTQMGLELRGRSRWKRKSATCWLAPVACFLIGPRTTSPGMCLDRQNVSEVTGQTECSWGDWTDRVFLRWLDRQNVPEVTSNSSLTCSRRDTQKSIFGKTHEGVWVISRKHYGGSDVDTMLNFVCY